MGPRFVRIPGDESRGLAELEQVLSRALPKSIHLLVLCRLAKQKAFPRDVHVHFYVYTDSEKDNEWSTGDGEPFVVCIQRPNFHTKKGSVILPPANLTAEMIQAFDNFIGWSEPQCFQCIPPSFWAPLQNLCTAHGNTRPENQLSGIPGIMYAMSDLEQAKDMQVPTGKFSLRSLEDKDVEEVAKQWKWRVNHSEEIIRLCIKTLTSCALFVGEDLASSVVQSPLGLFNVLYTSEKHRRQGYGKIVMECISKEAAVKQGIQPMAEVEVWNDASKSLLEKIGYVEVFKTKWFYYDPPTPVS